MNAVIKFSLAKNPDPTNNTTLAIEVIEIAAMSVFPLVRIL